MAELINVGIRLTQSMIDFLEAQSKYEGLSKSEIIRNLISDSMDKNESKMIKAIEDFEARFNDRQYKFEERLVKIIIKNSLYGLTNLNLIKSLIFESSLDEDLSTDEKFKKLEHKVSYAKKLALYHKVDGINSREEFDSNMLPEHKRENKK